MIGLGYNERPGNDRYLAFEGGVGTNLALTSNFRIKAELVSKVLTRDFDDDSRHSVSLRALPALKMANRIEVFGGPTLNYMYYERNDSSFPLPRRYLWNTTAGHDFHGIHLGWTAGVQVLF